MIIFLLEKTSFISSIDLLSSGEGGAEAEGKRGAEDAISLFNFHPFYYHYHRMFLHINYAE